MTTATTQTTTPAIEVTRDQARRLIAELEQHLKNHAPPPAPAPGAGRSRTAHRLVTASTSELVAQALAGLPPAEKSAGERDLPRLGRLARMMPDWALPALPGVRNPRRRALSVSQHLELTLLVLDKCGWARTNRPGRDRIRTRGGARCILGAQAVLYRLGFGTQHTAELAGDYLNEVLAGRNINSQYWEWNEHPGRGEGEVRCLIKQAAANARAVGR